MSKTIIESASDYPNKCVKYSCENGQVQITRCDRGSRKNLPLRNWVKYIYTAIILLEYLNSSLIFSLFAPAMVDMKYMFGTSMTYISYVNTFISIGYILGSLLGFLYNYLNRQLTSIAMTLVMGLFLTAMPFCSTVTALYACAFLSSMGSGGFDSGSYIWIIEMWQDNFSPVLHSTQLMFGLGNILGSLLVKPFVLGDVTKNNAIYASNNSWHVLNSTTVEEINIAVDRRSKLIVPFLIGGIITLAVPISLTMMYFIREYKPVHFDQNMNEKVLTKQRPSNTLTSPLVRNILVVMVALSLNAANGISFGHIFYSSTYYQYLSVGISASKAAQILSVMSTTFTVGRLVSVFVAIKVNTNIMIAYHLIIICVSMIFSYFGHNSITCIWIANALIGFGCSALWSTYFSLAEHYIKLTDKITSILLFTSQIFPVITPFFIGPLIERYPQTFLYLELNSLIVIIILFIIIQILIKNFCKK